MRVFGNVQFLLNGIKLLNSNVTSFIKSISDFEWMDAFVQKLLSLIEDGSSEYDNTGCAISNFIILGS